MGDPILTPKFRVSFPQVFEPKSVNGGTAKYSITMLFPAGTDLTDLKKAAEAAAVEKWGEKLPKNLKSPFRDGAEKEHLDGYEAGITFVRATSTVQPEVLDQAKKAITNQRDFYAGCFGRAVVAAFAYDQNGNKGVSFGIRAVQKTGDGAGFGAGGSKADMFDEIEDDASAIKSGGDSLFG